MHRTLRYAAVSSLVLGLVTLTGPSTARDADRYRNPLEPSVKRGQVVESCADPVVLRGRGEDRRRWYMYCTTDPLNDQDRTSDGELRFHPIPMLVSRDLVNWRYVGDALPAAPTWAAAGAGLWAPDLAYSRATDRYYLTFTVTDTDRRVSGVGDCASDSAIGVATSKSPTGPWTVSETPVVAPRQNADGCDFFWTFDPDVLGDSIGRNSVLYYGSYYGGVFAQRMRVNRTGMSVEGAARRVADGVDREPRFDPVELRTQPRAFRALADGRAITIPNRYEGSNVVRRRDWYYYFGSATNCCAGPLTGYSVFAGRSRSPFGPFLDREGNSLLAGRVGGTPVLSMNGNRWVGLGHNSTFRDRDGQWWTAYHAVDRNRPWFRGERGFTKRPALLDPVTWRGGWPSVRAGRWASDRVMPAPAAQPGERSRYEPRPVAPHRLGSLLLEETFSGSELSDEWTWARQPTASAYGVEGGRLRFDVQQADLYVDSDPVASVLTRPAPGRRYVVETKVAFDVPPEGAGYNFAQAGVVVYGSKNRFLKLTHAAIHETRQTEWAKEVPSGLIRYGNTVVGPPGDETWLRIVADRNRFTAYTSQDGSRWVRGGTWTHDRLGNDVRIGLVSMGLGATGPDDPEPVELTGRFDYVKVWELR